MINIQVACAIIENNGRVLAAQRSELMSLPLKWEFPGGKIEGFENPEQCLVRELTEELNITVAVGHLLPPVGHNYADFSVILHPFICTIVSGEITLHEHKAIVWLSPQELPSLDWAAADIPVVSAYLENLKMAVVNRYTIDELIGDYSSLRHEDISL